MIGAGCSETSPACFANVSASILGRSNGKKLETFICLIATWYVLSCGDFTESLVKRAVPAFPEFPASVDDLSNGQEGVIYFKTSTPFDLDVLLGDPSLGIPTTGVGTLFLPETSTPTRSPAMVLLHGSGGISPGREMEYGQLLADNGIGVGGFSYGGMAARFAMDDRIHRALAPEHKGFAAFVDYYGPCFQNLAT